MVPNHGFIRPIFPNNGFCSLRSDHEFPTSVREFPVSGAQEHDIGIRNPKIVIKIPIWFPITGSYVLYFPTMDFVVSDRIVNSQQQFENSRYRELKNTTLE